MSEIPIYQPLRWFLSETKFVCKSSGISSLLFNSEFSGSELCTNDLSEALEFC